MEYGKIVSIVVGKRNGRAGHRHRVPLEREGITISRATSTYSPFVRGTLRVERERETSKGEGKNKVATSAPRPQNSRLRII